MPRQSESSAIVDGVLRLIAIGGLTFAALLAPNTLQMMDKPLQRYFSTLDKRARERELRRISRYLREKKLVAENYEYGLELTAKARKRLAKNDITQLTIPTPAKWDKLWRVIFYDIPEDRRKNRNTLAFKLRQLGCYQLQRSVWVHPYPCHDVIATIAQAYQVESYITLIEANSIANQKQLIKKFPILTIP
mgnify:CR=1 FL=1